ncbi:hypothetical protein BDF19DRAFT_106019 [Syncephalis fuscata]|nr:hypothetical protein BDF19DRAFT_106019 [Syncephalis fuscata]
MFRQASLNTFQSTTVTTQSPGMSATHVTNQFDTASNPIDELLRTRSQLLPTAHRPTDNHQHNHGMQMTLPPPPAPISTAFEHYAPEEQRGHAASLLALLTSGHPAATHGPPPIPYYSNQQPLQHQPQREKDLLAVLQPPSNSHNSSHHSNTSNNPAYYQQQPQQPQQLPHTNQLHPSNAPPMALPPHADTAADRALNRLFSRFAPSQSQPLFVQTVLHAVQHDPEFVELFYLLYRHARPVPNSSNSNNTGSGSGGGFNFS